MQHNKLTFFILFLMCFSTAMAQPRKYSNEFMSIGVGAEAFAKGNAMVATTSNINSGYWNPAGLVRSKYSYQLGLMHAQYFAGIANHDYGAIGIKIDTNQAVGFSLIRTGVDDIPYTINLLDDDGTINYDNVSSFSAVDYGMLLTYSRRIVKGLTVGANVKVIRRTAGSFARSWGFGLDVGAQYQRKNWRAGVMLRDISTTYNLWSFSYTQKEKEVLTAEGNQLPTSSQEITTPKIIVGGAYQKRFKKFELLVALDVDISTDGRRNTLLSSNRLAIDPHMGVEIGFAEIVYARFGINNIQKIPDGEGKSSINVQPNLGIGLQFKGIHLDYAFTDIGNVGIASFSHVVSLNVGFNKKQDQE